MPNRNTKDQPRSAPESRSAQVLTPRKMRRAGRKLGKPQVLSLRRPFIRRVEPQPLKDSEEIAAPVIASHQAAIRQTKDYERTYYEQESQLSQEIASDEQIVRRTADSRLPLPGQHLSVIVYLPLLVCFGVAEACVNMVIFLVLAMSQMQTYLASLMLAVSLPLLAHFTGRAWRQIEHDKQNRLVAWAATGAALVAISAIAAVRCAYVSLTMQNQLGLHLSPLTVTVVFWAMNLAVFVAATLAAHAHAVADPQGEQLACEVLAAEDRLVRNRERLKSLPREARTRCEQADCDDKALAAAFHQGNIEARRVVDPEPPVWMAHLPDVPLPEVFRMPEADEPPAPAAIFVGPSPWRPNRGGSVSTSTDPQQQEVTR